MLGLKPGAESEEPQEPSALPSTEARSGPAKEHEPSLPFVHSLVQTIEKPSLNLKTRLQPTDTPGCVLCAPDTPSVEKHETFRQK